jgi:hypothetical protein
VAVDFELDPAQQAWLAEVREFLQQNVTDELLEAWRSWISARTSARA